MKKVFVNGTFDILHVGHIRLFEFAKQHGDYLLVALDTDDRIKKLKGHGRPINKLDIRLEMMLSLKSVDSVTHFSTDEELKDIVFQYQPDVMIVGSDYRDKPVIGSEHAKKLIFFDRIEEYSTTKTIQSIIAR